MQISKLSYPPTTGISEINPHIFPCSSPTLCYLTRLSKFASSLKLLRNIIGNRNVKKPHSKPRTNTNTHWWPQTSCDILVRCERSKSSARMALLGSQQWTMRVCKGLTKAAESHNHRMPWVGGHPRGWSPAPSPAQDHPQESHPRSAAQMLLDLWQAWCHRLQPGVPQCPSGEQTKCLSCSSTQLPPQSPSLRS